jgi:hypothetical protein
MGERMIRILRLDEILEKKYFEAEREGMEGTNRDLLLEKAAR